jgi:hypothetical protein
MLLQPVKQLCIGMTLLLSSIFSLEKGLWGGRVPISLIDDDKFKFDEVGTDE